MHWRGTVSLGSPKGIAVRLHWTIFLFVLIEMIEAVASAEISVARVSIALGGLFVAILLHEWGHCFAARRLGAHPADLVLGPFGGLEPVAISRDAREERITALGGPAVNALILLLLGAYVIATDQVNSFIFRLDPVGRTPDLIASFWGVNLDLLIVNLIPAYPFDGGRVLHSLVWGRTDAPTALSKIVLSSRLCAAGCALAWLLRLDPGGNLLFIGMFCLIGSEIERRRALETEPDWLRSGEMERDGRLARWWHHRHDVREAERRESAARERVADEAQLDELLGKVHRVGLEGLSRRERRFLERLGKRIRDRDDPTSRKP